MHESSKIVVLGHRGLVGSAILFKLKEQGYTNIITKTHSELDLTIQKDVNDFFQTEKPDIVFFAAAKVGGIVANNTYPAEFIYKNLMMEANVIHASYLTNVSKLCFLGSSCIYPRDCLQPIKEEYLLSGKLESTNQPYALAKIAGIELVNSYRRQYGCHFISLMPTNLYGPNDNYDLQNSHVLPALIRKLMTAKQKNEPQVTIWGDGSPLREFLHSYDLAEACIYFTKTYDGDIPLNIGTGKDISIKELAHMIVDLIGYTGELVFDTSKPNGTLRKVLDTTKANSLGWTPNISLREGIKSVIDGGLPPFE